MKNAWLIVLLLCNSAILAEDKKEEPVNDPAFHARLLEVAKTYIQFGRVDDLSRWAPYLCKTPNPSAARASKSKDDTTHGQKLYFLFVNQREEYIRLKDPAPKAETAPISTGMSLVKESWTPVELEPGENRPEAQRKTVELTAKDVETVSDEARFMDKPEPKNPPKTVHEYFTPSASVNGKLYKTGEKRDLFIMYKTDPKTPGTNQGWVYGTVTPDGKTVTSAGCVQSCVKCHENAPHDHLFGLAPLNDKLEINDR